MKDIELYCRTCAKRLPHRWGVGGCACLECSTMFDPHKRTRLQTPEPGRATRSYDGGMVPENWREIVNVYETRIEQEIDRVLVGTVSCTCNPEVDDECSSCEAVECALEEIAVSSLFIARRQSYRHQWECQRDAMSRMFERLREAGYVGHAAHRETSTR